MTAGVRNVDIVVVAVDVCMAFSLQAVMAPFSLKSWDAYSELRPPPVLSAAATFRLVVRLYLCECVQIMAPIAVASVLVVCIVHMYGCVCVSISECVRLRKWVAR